MLKLPNLVSQEWISQELWAASPRSSHIPQGQVIKSAEVRKLHLRRGGVVDASASDEGWALCFLYTVLMKSAATLEYYHPHCMDEKTEAQRGITQLTGRGTGIPAPVYTQSPDSFH